MGQGSREISGPKIVVIRNRDNRYGENYKRVPVNELLLEQRAGSMEIVCCMEGLTLSTTSGGNKFKNGVGFKYTWGCEVLVDVFPRGQEAKYAQWQRDITEPTSFITGINSPVLTSRTARAYPSGVHRVSEGADYTEILSESDLQTYLKTHLPLLGVAEKDVTVVIRRIEKLIREGKAEALRRAQLLEQKRVKRRS
ncbi:MAG TPA: hypothetical protein VD907_06170 [Verrucomicrobiae bacterium]|nr:hypothetical protein [Verrucomicrobiae bacterium]